MQRSLSSVVVTLVLLSAFAHALWNALLKRTREPTDASIPLFAVCAASSVALAIAAGAHVPPPRALVWCLGSGVLEAAYFVTLARALARAPLGPVYTVVRGGALVVVWPITLAFLGERLTAASAGGVALIAAGLVATGAADGQRDRSRGALVRNLGWAAISAVFVAGYHVSYKVALSDGAEPLAAAGVSLSVASALNVAVVGRGSGGRAWKALREQPVRIVVGGLLANLGFALFIYAMAHAGAGAVTTLRNTSVLFAQLFATMQGDRPKGLGLVGAACVTAGAVLLSR